MSKSVTIFLVKSFTQDKSFGSPTGIVLDADNLSEQQMQAIATKLNFAESAFVLKSSKADYRLRFFAPNHEVALCGHATIASFHLLAEQGRITFGEKDSVTLTQETSAGLLQVTCNKDSRIVMSQNDPTFGDIETDRERIANLLNISASDFLDYPVQVVSTGTPKLLIPLASLKALRAVQQNVEGIKQYCRETEAKGFYPFTMESPIPDTDFFARQFNPLADENEDPLTGVAAGALGCYAKKYKLLEKEQLIVAQGYDLGMGGNMLVDVSNGVQVGGYAVTYGKIEEAHVEK
jgi:PhzF family phenazine biosynthesis protein